MYDLKSTTIMPDHRKNTISSDMEFSAFNNLTTCIVTLRKRIYYLERKKVINNNSNIRQALCLSFINAPIKAMPKLKVSLMILSL